MYVRRRLEGWLKKALRQFPVILITGPRQAGKSTMLRQALSQFDYVTLDDPLVRQLAREDPELFLANHPAPVVIDEIQYAPSLFSYLKMKVDADRSKRGLYVLTGSQTFQVMQGVSESLAGRIAIFDLYPFSWTEVERVPGLGEIAHDPRKMAGQMIRGFYPEFFVNPDLDPRLWHSSYISTYLERDVRNIKSVPDLGTFQKFVVLLAARAGQLLNVSELAKECGISQPTAKSWISILESTYIIYLLRPYHNNRTKRLVKSPKIYFVDTGLLCYLLGIGSTEHLMETIDRGHLFENMVIMECVKHLSTSENRGECFFYRTASGVEIDLVVKRGPSLELYEIKFAKTIRKEMARNLTLFRQEHEVERAVLLSLSEKKGQLAKGVEMKHWTEIFSE